MMRNLLRSRLFCARTKENGRRFRRPFLFLKTV
jgi:hypothetical protein